MKLYQQIATSLQAMANCEASGNAEWLAKHYDNIKQIVADHMPSGSGWDCGTSFDFDTSKPNRLVFFGSFHHMNEAGYYDGWTEHAITVTPDLASGFDLKVSGRNRNEIKDYLAEMFHAALSQDLVWSEDHYQTAA